MCEPDFLMIWAEEIPKIVRDGATVTVFVGAFGSEAQVAATPVNSWAHDPQNDVAVFLIDLEPGASLVLPPARIGAAANRRLYAYTSTTGVAVDGKRIGPEHYATLDAAASPTLKNESEGDVCRLMLLQGGARVGACATRAAAGAAADSLSGVQVDRSASRLCSTGRS